MPEVNVRETRQNISQILEAVTTGEEFVNYPWKKS